MKVSVVIVSWNTRHYLAACLTSLKAEIERWSLSSQYQDADAQKSVEVYVVDNASSDGTSDMVRSHFPWVHLMVNAKNVGFSAANNQAIEASQGEYVLLLNPDTEVEKDALATLITFMDSHPQAGASGSRLLNPDGTLQESCYPFPTLTRELWRMFHLDALRAYGRYTMKRWSLQQPKAIDVVQGASLMVRRTVLDEVGTLDPDYFIYTEEVDLCRRIQQQKWQIFWVPQSVVTHYGGQSTQQVEREMFLTLYETKIIYFRKHYGWWSTLGYKLVLLAAALVRLMISPILWLEPLAQRQAHRTLTGHYMRLVTALPRM